MVRQIVPVVHIRRLSDPQSDFEYWQHQSYQARLTALEEIRREYHAWLVAQKKEAANVQSGFQRVYRIGNRKESSRNAQIDENTGRLQDLADLEKLGKKEE